MLGDVVYALTTIILFGRITGLFATKSFSVDCHNQYENFVSTIINNSVCPFGIDLNPFNYDRLHKLCHYDNKIVPSTLSPITPLFRENVMHLVYLFFGLSILGFLCISLNYICWTIATKRQTSRMSILLFRSLIQRVITKETEEQLNTYSKAEQIAQEVFSSLRTVLSFNGRKYQQKQYEKELKLNEWFTVRKDIAFGTFFGWLFFINFLVYSIGFTFGSILMSDDTHHTLTISEILIVVNMFAQALGFLNAIGPFFQSISEAQGAAVSVFRLIDEVHDENLNEREILEENISDEKSISNINGDIEFDNVSFSYPSRENATALNNLKLIARANQTTALVGSSGCEVAYFDRPENSSGAICNQLSSNAAVIQDMVGSRLGVICETLSMSAIGVLLGLFYNWQLTIIIFIPFVILLIAFIIQIRLSSWLKSQSDLIYCQASTLAVEVLTNMRTVKQLSIENEVLRQYSNMIDQVLRISAFAMFALESLKVVQMLAQRMGTSLTAAHAFFDLFDRIPTIDNGLNKGQELVNFRGEADFNQVKFVYPSRPTVLVLNKLQLSIKSGQRIALVGASGCGKSTIVQLLERFYDVTHGELTLDGVDIRQLNLQWLRSRLGVVSQEPVLFDLTIAENITYGLENISIDEIILAATKANIHQFIQQLPQGYETKVGVKGSFLSGGEKQRIAIARVLIRRPKILLLDEATSAMDPYNEQIVQETLEQAQTEDPSRTSIIIAHRLATIRSCDLIHVLEMGRIVESGTHTELIEKHGIYYKMLNAQNNVQ
ncbi:unnamed protein product [Adineta steineri]|uniref:Uncharacterized protein n=1 Tax=Adineta steineri TaxID=433720 RepID=A0A815LHU8_9BILA|nr:unnamed protein product [Adineta steineri]